MAEANRNQLEKDSLIRQDFLVLVAIFISFRILAIVFFKPGGEVFIAGDFRFYLDMAEITLDGLYPYRDFWVEYPPLFPLVLVGLYHLSLLLPSWPSPMLWFQISVSSFLLAFEIGNLLLVYAIAKRIHGPDLALRAGWIYAGLFMPVFALTNWFDAFPLFFLLLALYLALSRRPFLAGLAIGLGFMAKLFPAVAAPASFLSWQRWRERIAYVAGAVAGVALVAAPFLLTDPTMLIASFRSMIARASWLTPWAYLEGFFEPGYMPIWAARFVPEHAEWQMHSESLPWFLIYGALAAGCAVLFTRRLRWQEPRVLVTATALAFHLLLLFAKGYSPQFLVYILALLVIVLPGPWGVAYALLLTFNSFMEWPWAGVFFGDEHWLLWALVLMRTALLVVLSWEYLVVLYPSLRPRWESVRRAAALPVVGVLVAGALVGAPVLADRYATTGDQYDIVTYIRGLGQPQQALATSSREMFYALKARFPDDRLLSPRDDIWEDEAHIAATLASLAEGSTQTWVILDHTTGHHDRRELLLRWFDEWGSRATDIWFGPYRLLGYVPYAGADLASVDRLEVDFAGQLELVGWHARSTELRPGAPVRVTLYWRALDVPRADYKVFVHVVDSAGEMVTQRDRTLDSAGLPSSQWQKDLLVREAYDLDVPEDAEPGRYVVVVGLYEPESGQRLTVTGGEADGHDSLSLGEWTLRLLPAD